MKAAAFTQPKARRRPAPAARTLDRRRQDSKVNGDPASFVRGCGAPRPPGAPRPQNRRVSLAFRGIAGKGREEQMEQNALFRKRYGSFRRFFAMLGKARLPYLWIVGVSGGIGPHCQCERQHDRIQRRAVRRPGGPFRRRAALPVFYAAIAGDRLHFQPDKQPVPGADRPEPAAEGVEKGRASAAAIL